VSARRRTWRRPAICSIAWWRSSGTTRRSDQPERETATQCSRHGHNVVAACVHCAHP
jgi:hypothetical protein